MATKNKSKKTAKKAPPSKPANKKAAAKKPADKAEKTAARPAKPAGKAKKNAARPAKPAAKKTAPAAKAAAPQNDKKSAAPEGKKNLKPSAAAHGAAKETAVAKKDAAVKAEPKPLHPTVFKIRNALMKSRLDLFNILQSSKELERNVSELNFSNEIDLAASLEGREMAFTLSSRDRNELKLIDDALFRISSGTYGTCEACAKPIGLKRLEIMPLTAYCIECQENLEHI